MIHEGLLPGETPGIYTPRHTDKSGDFSRKNVKNAAEFATLLAIATPVLVFAFIFLDFALSTFNQHLIFRF